MEILSFPTDLQLGLVTMKRGLPGEGDQGDLERAGCEPDRGRAWTSNIVSGARTRGLTDRSLGRGLTTSKAMPHLVIDPDKLAIELLLANPPAH